MSKSIINIQKFIRRIPEGATRPFVSLDEGGSQWVIKPHGNPLGEKTSFNEYVASSLANVMGLPWPQVRIANISPAVLEILASEEILCASNWAVALEFIEGLKDIPLPDNFLDNPKNVNPPYIKRHFPKQNYLDFFYGKAVFDDWLCFYDRKYDTLKMQKNGRPIFLDASLAFGGSDWKLSQLEWKDTEYPEFCWYLEGLLTDLFRFEPWLKKISSIPMSVLDNIFFAIPHDWNVPTDYMERAKDLLLSTEAVFVRYFREWMVWKKEFGT